MTEAHDKREMGMPVQESELDFETVFNDIAYEQEETSGVSRSQWKARGRVSKAWPAKENDDWWLYHGPSFVRNWIVWLNNNPWVIWITPDGEPAIEVPIEPTIGGVPIKGYIDRILEAPDGTLCVVDLKSGVKMPEDKLQLGTYGEGLPEGWPLITNGSFFDCRAGIFGGAADLSHWQGKALAHDYGTAWRGIELGIFPARRQPLCKSCGVNRACYAYGGSESERFAPFSEPVLPSDHEQEQQEAV